ncbi:hypothetical protein D1007_27514 [Hordeum vulgare]|nr:hypothetical protein D1007_27514 [Hordeum vulgare]
MGLKDANPRLEELKGLPEKTFAWSSAKLSDPRVASVLERFSRDISAKRLTGGMIVKEFLDLPTDELSRVVAILLGGDPGDLPEALGPLYRLDNPANMIVRLPVFDERGLLPATGSGPVEVSSGDTSHEGDSEKTVEDYLASAPFPS